MLKSEQTLDTASMASTFSSSRSVGSPTHTTAAHVLPARHDIIKINSYLGAGYHIALDADKDWIHFIQLAVLQEGQAPELTATIHSPPDPLGGSIVDTSLGHVSELMRWCSG